MLTEGEAESVCACVTTYTGRGVMLSEKVFCVCVCERLA